MQTVPRRILIVRPSALGDVCRTVPLLWSLRAAYPQATIDWVVEDRWTAVLSSHPALNEAIPFPKRSLRSFWRSPSVARTAIEWFCALRRRRYDLVIDAQGLARSGLMSLATGAQVRVAHRNAGEFSWIAANVRVGPSSTVHVVDGMLRLVEAVGVAPVAKMNLVCGQADATWWQNQQQARGIARPYLVVASTNLWAGKRWIASRWHELLVSIAPDLTAHGIRDIVWIGGPSEVEQVAANRPRDGMIAPLRSHDLSGATTVGEIMAVVRDAALVVALDSAPAHLAVGFQVPLVALYGATSLESDGPYGQSEWCAHGGRGEKLKKHDYRDVDRGSELMARITVDDVATLIRKRLHTREHA